MKDHRKLKTRRSPSVLNISSSTTRFALNKNVWMSSTRLANVSVPWAAWSSNSHFAAMSRCASRGSPCIIWIHELTENISKNSEKSICKPICQIITKNGERRITLPSPSTSIDWKTGSIMSEGSIACVTWIEVWNSGPDILMGSQSIVGSGSCQYLFIKSKKSILVKTALCAMSSMSAMSLILAQIQRQNEQQSAVRFLWVWT